MLLRVMACRWANNVAMGCPMRAVTSKSHQRVRRCTDVYNGNYRLLYTFPGNRRAPIASYVQMCIPVSCAGEVRKQRFVAHAIASQQSTVVT